MSAKLHSAFRRAFTIVELLVAVGVTAILVTLMVTITINVLNAWNRSSGNLSAGNQARLVLDQLSQDLQGAIIRRDNNVWLVATVQGNQTAGGDAMIGNWSNGAKPQSPGTQGSGSFVINPLNVQPSIVLENFNYPLGIENYRFGQAGVWLRFFTTPPDNQRPPNAGVNDPVPVENSSAPRAVSYQIVRRSLTTGADSDIIYTLYRSEVRPAAASGLNSTFGAGYDLLMNGGYNSTDPDVNTVGGPGGIGNIRRPHPDYIIANDVIDFGVKFYAGRDSAGNDIELFPVQRNGSNIVQPSGLPFSFAVSTRENQAGINFGYPTAADVMVRILTPEGVRLIQAIEKNTLQADWWETAIQHSQVYTRRIEIKSKGL